MSINTNTYYSNILKNLLAKELSQSVETMSNQSIQKLIINLQTYLNDLNNWNHKTSLYLSKFVISDSDASEEFKRYIVAKKMIQLEPEIEMLLKEGYIIIDLLREFITGEHITYRIGVEYKGRLYEGILSLEDIMSMAKVEPVWRGSVNSMVKLRLSGESRASLKDKLTEIEDFRHSQSHSTLYSSIREYASSTKKTNRGNIYEAYRLLKNKYGSNTIPPAYWNADEFEDAYLKVRSNTASYVKGGDILTEQVKFFGGSAPSLTTLSTIKNTLTFIIETFSTFNGVALRQELNTFFSKNSSEVDLSSSSIEEFVEDNVKSLISVLNLTK